MADPPQSALSDGSNQCKLLGQCLFRASCALCARPHPRGETIFLSCLPIRPRGCSGPQNEACLLPPPQGECPQDRVSMAAATEGGIDVESCTTACPILLLCFRSKTGLYVERYGDSVWVACLTALKGCNAQPHGNSQMCLMEFRQKNYT